MKKLANRQWRRQIYRIVEEQKKASIILKFRASPFIIDIDFCFDWLDMGSRARGSFITIHNGAASLFSFLSFKICTETLEFNLNTNRVVSTRS